MAAPAWQAATPAQPGLAAHVNQFLGTHQITYLPAGTLQAQEVTGASGTAASTGTWIAQRFTAGSSQVSAGYAVITAALSGSPPPWQFTLRPDTGTGAPSATVLARAAVPKEFLPSPAPVGFPLPATGLTPGAVYWITAEAAGDSGDYWTWSRSSQSSGASTSPDGTTWTAQAYGLVYQVYDQSPVPPLQAVYEDGGARWTWLGAGGSGQPFTIAEYTAGQTADGYAVTVRDLSYSGTILTGAA